MPTTVVLPKPAEAMLPKPAELNAATEYKMTKSLCPGLSLITPPLVKEEVVVRTSLGLVKGFTQADGASGGTAVHFRGIPFAEAPVGANRFKPPQPRGPWSSQSEPLDCTRYGLECREPVGEVRKMMKGYGKKVTEVMATGYVGDDCLNLNVVTPSVTSGGKLCPTMVWIHGGANVMSGGNGSGMAFAPTCSEKCAKAGVVVVSIHYRQGIHGFAHFPKLGITNLMLRDCIASLEWVQREIAAFGGDPTNVTIFGESAGAIACSCLLACERAQPLFHRAIVQSGAISALPLQVYEDVVENDFVEALMPALKANGHQELTLEALATLSGEQMSAARLKNSLTKAGVLMSPMDFHHVLGDDLLPDDPYAALAGGRAAGKPVLVMSCQQEVDMMKFSMPLGSVLLPLAAGMIGKMALRGVGFDAFTKGSPSAALVSAFWADLVKGFEEIGAKAGKKGTGKLRALNYLFGTCGIATTKLVDALLAAPSAAPVFASILETSAAESPKLGNGHTLDMFLLFRSDVPAYDKYMAEMLCGRPAFGDALDRLSSNMLSAWCNFASCGTPGSFDGVEWPTMPSQMVMRSAHSAIEESDHAEGSKERQLWERLCSKYEVSMEYSKRHKRISAEPRC